MSEYLSKEEIKKWRSSVEKITLEEYAARLGKKLQEEKKTNDLADMLYQRFNPAQSPANYDTMTKLEKIDLTSKAPSPKTKKQSSQLDDDLGDFDVDDDLMFEDDLEMDIKPEKPAKKEKTPTTKEPVKKEKKETVKAGKKEELTAKEEKPVKEAKTAEEKKPAKKLEKAPVEIPSNFANLNITFKKPLTDREEKVLAHFVDKRGEIVYAKDIAELLDLKRDYIYKYIKNLRAKMSTDLIANADNGGFKLE